MFKIEQLLKTLMTPVDPMTVFVDRYMMLYNQDASLSGFQKILELKVRFYIVL